MNYFYKQVPYTQLDRVEKVHKGKVVMGKGDWDMVRDYILFLEGELHQANGSTFSDIKTEMVKRLGEEKVKKFYKN